MDPMSIKLTLLFYGAFILGFVFGYEYALFEQGGVCE